MLCFIVVPLAQWEVPEVTIPEGDSAQVCFIRTADSAQSYEIRVGVRGKGDRPASSVYITIIIIVFLPPLVVVMCIESRGKSYLCYTLEASCHVND